MKRGIFICNTVLQVLIAVWMKYDMLKDEVTDIIISNHMNGNEIIAENLNKTGLFNSVITVASLDYSRGKCIQRNRFFRLLHRRFPYLDLKDFADIKNRYDNLYIANFDLFSQLIYDFLARKNKKLNLILFEDGTSSYSLMVKKYYDSTMPPDNKKTRFIYKTLLNKKFIYGNIKAFWLFRPDLMEWKPNFPTLPIKKIDSENKEFRTIINTAFGYDTLDDQYAEKFIFFEEAFFAESGYMEDVELVEELAEIVGKENIFIKIHPRNPKNRFKELGYATNANTFIPWEIIAMNLDITGKKLISIMSSSIMNPVSILGLKCKSYSVIECLKSKPDILNDDFGKCIVRLFENYNEIHICKDIEEVLKDYNES